MRKKRQLIAIAGVFLLALSTMFAGQARSQCGIIYSMNVTALYPGASSTAVVRAFSGTTATLSCTYAPAGANTTCGQAMASPGMFACPGPGSCRFIYAVAMNLVASPGNRTCNFNCGACGAQVINNSNGLPVELMDFSVESDESDETDADSDRAGSPDGRSG